MGRRLALPSCEWWTKWRGGVLPVSMREKPSERTEAHPRGAPSVNTGFVVEDIGLSSYNGGAMVRPVDSKMATLIEIMLAGRHAPHNPAGNFFKLTPENTLLGYRGAEEIAIACAWHPYFIGLPFPRLYCCTSLIADSFWRRSPDITVTFSRWLCLAPHHALDEQTLSLWMMGVEEPARLAASAALARTGDFGPLDFH